MKLLFIFVSGLILFSGFAFCQFNSRLGLEAGYFNIHNPFLPDREDLLMRAEGELSYNNSGDNGSFKVLARLRPEWTGVETALRSVKMGAQADYFFETESFGFGLAASANRNLYNIYQPLISHDLMNLQGDVTYGLPSEVTLRFSPGYFRQVISYQTSQVTDLLALKLSLGKSLFGEVNTEGGIYSEFFSVRKNATGPLLAQKDNSVPGWKMGPELNFTYSEGSIVNLQYRFLLVNSKNTSFPSYEEMVRFMAGIMPWENISIMLLADYYWHKIKVLKGTDSLEASILNYSSLNYENRLLLKIGFDVSESVELYLRTGYSKENLIGGNFSEDSWSLMLGFGFTK